MKIDGVDIAGYGTMKQWRANVGHMEHKNESGWIRGSPLPFFDANQIGFKDLTVTLMIYGRGRESIREKISKILALLLGDVELELDNYGHKFHGILTKSSTKEYNDWAREWFQSLVLEFDAYEHGDEVKYSFSGKTAIAVTNPGNITSPVAVEVTPQVGIASLTLTGICRDPVTGEDLPVTIRNLSSGKKVTLDGITGLITENGTLKAGDVDIWALPTCQPGANTITLDSDNINTAVKILPLYA